MKAIGALMTTLVAVWTSRKLWMTIIGICVIYGLYWHSVYWLVTVVPVEKIAAVQAMFNVTQIAIIGAILGYLGVQGWQNVYSVSSVATTALQHIVEKTETKTTVVNENPDPAVVAKFAAKYADDKSYRPPATVPDQDVEVFR